MQPKKQCAFCPTEGNKLSGEHLWDDWLNEEVTTKKYRACYGTLTKETVEWDAHSLNHKLPSVCPTCNSGWMSQLTQELKAAFSDCILEDGPLSILPDDLPVLSAYTFLKAAVMDYTYCEGEPFFTRAARERFRIARTIPDYAQIWLAQFRGRAAFSTRANIRHYENRRPGTPFFGIEWFAFTYVIGHLALQLLMPRWKDVLYRGLPLPTLNPHTQWNEAATRIWPPSGHPVSWPPFRLIGDETYHVFAHRFGGQITVNIDVGQGVT